MQFDDKALFDLVPEQQSPDARREIMEHLLKSIRDIEAQLGSKNKTDMSGARLSPSEYVRWRAKAIHAMNHRVALYKKYKTIEKASQNVQEKTNPAGSTAEILAGADATAGDTASEAGDTVYTADTAGCLTRESFERAINDLRSGDGYNIRH